VSKFNILNLTPNSDFKGTPLFDVQYLRNAVKTDIVTMEY